jgi:hypothetical protein
MGNTVLFVLKGGQGSGWFGLAHGGTHGKRAAHEEGRDAGGSSGLPSSIAEITDEKSAVAYWRAHFDAGRAHRIECRYGTRKYVFHVAFGRNHAYTEDTLKTGRDDGRAFSLARARGMDAIWQVLRMPSAVNWSDTDPRNKQFDRVLDVGHRRYGRVILEPTPTTEDIANNTVTHFAFVSWHEPDADSFAAAKSDAARKRVAPTEMKKAQSFDWAFLPSRTSSRLPVSGGSPEALPALEGIPFDWTSCFQDRHYRMAEASDGQTECHSSFSHAGDFSRR